MNKKLILLKVCCRVVDPNTLNLDPDPVVLPNLDPDPIVLPNLDPDPGLPVPVCYNFFITKEEKFPFKNSFNCKKLMAPEEIFGQ